MTDPTVTAAGRVALVALEGNGEDEVGLLGESAWERWNRELDEEQPALERAGRAWGHADVWR